MKTPNHWTRWEREYRESHYQEPHRKSITGLLLLLAFITILIAAFIN